MDTIIKRHIITISQGYQRVVKGSFAGEYFYLPIEVTTTECVKGYNMTTKILKC